ncbi:MAG: LLM class flavin-dependent oxidoreductase [Actinomycetota bacterium]
MKVRIGIGAAPIDAVGLDDLAAGITKFGFDSIWLPEVLSNPALDPSVALSYVAAKFPALKLGTTTLFSGVSPVALAKRLASLDQLSGGRLLVTAVPGLTTDGEPGALGVHPRKGGPVIEDALEVIRALWRGETVTHSGPSGSFDGVRISPLPIQQPLEVWLGGNAEKSLQRCGRIGDGWLPAMCTPSEVERGREVIESAAVSAGRQISDEHYGVSIGYFTSEYPDGVSERLSSRLGGRKLEDVVPARRELVPQLLERFLEVGFSKFVLRPLEPVHSWDEELSLLGPLVVGLQT